MGIEQYDRAKKKLLEDKDINKDNKKLFKEFFEWEEYKLKRKNNLPKLDNGCYKTLDWYLINLRNVNKWFKNKAWKTLTKEDIKEVYDKLEDGKIISQRGKPVKDRKSFYNRIFKSKAFELAGKKELAQEVIEFYTNRTQEVRYIEFEDFKKLVKVAIQPKQKFLMWLSFDIGENINTLLELQKKDFIRQINPDTKEAEYLVNLPTEKIKRSRQTRSEITNFKETIDYADILLKDLKDNDKVFNFGYRQSLKFFDRAVNITKIKCKPKAQKPSWKDLRSSMACYLLKEGWTTDEINARLGHKPSSRELDKYINFLAINRHKPKQKLFSNDMERIQTDIEELKKIIKLLAKRQEDKFEDYTQDLLSIRNTLKAVEKKVKK